MSELSIKRLVPAYIYADKNGYALARAIETAMRYVQDRCQEGLAILNDYDAMPEWRCDELAWDNNVTWYDSAATLEEKRQTLKDARAISASLGTPDAVLLGFYGVYGAGQVQEWWDYGGDPGHFKIFTVSETTMTTDFERFMRIVNAVKNVRSVLDGVYYRGAKGSAEMWLATGPAAITRGSGGYANNYSENG